jgi:FMN reductase/FAD reductase [NAD(P)H]
MKLLGISGTLVGDKTVTLVRNVLDEVKRQDPGIEVQLLDLKDYDVQFCDGRDPLTYTGDTKKVIDLVDDADCYIIGTPIFQGSITGALKNLFDLVPPSAFRHKTVGLVATGGTYQHYLVVENQLKPILSYFRAYVVPGYTYVYSDHFDENNEITDPEVSGRISSLAEEVIFMQRSLKRRWNNG